MSRYGVCELSKAPKEILIKMLLAKDNTEHFDLSYCYTMKNKINSRIEKLKTEDIKRKLLDLESEENVCKDFISKMTDMKCKTLIRRYLDFYYLNYNIHIHPHQIHVTLESKVVYNEIIRSEIIINDIEFSTSLQSFHILISRKIGIYTLFESIIRFLESDELELNI